KETNRKKEIRIAQKFIQDNRALQEKALQNQIKLFKDMGKDAKALEAQEKLCALYETPLPQPDMPITAEVDPPSSKPNQIVTPSENGASIDLTESVGGASSPEEDEGGE
ncbi:unnamed protein product, partial [Ectocarpus fasciculatus]